MRSRLALLTVLLLLVQVPTGSAQNPVTDLCFEADLGYACEGAVAASHSLAWLCRHNGGQPEQCDQLDGRSIRSEQVDWFQFTTTRKLMDAKRDVEDNTPLGRTTWFGTHNSFNSAWYDRTAVGSTLSSQDPNQQYSMYDQLRLGARTLELDLHWMPSTDPDLPGFAAVVCHGRSAQEMHAGCTTEATLPTVLPEIQLWLEEHPDEILLLHLEDQLTNLLDPLSDGHASAGATLDAAFGDLAFRPEHSGRSCEDGLPLDWTRKEMKDQGKQVLLVGPCSGDATWNGLVHSDTVRWHQQGLPADGCIWDDSTFAGNWTRIWEDSTFVSRSGQEFGVSGEVGRLDTTNIPVLTDCKFNMVGFDQLVPDDGRISSFAWAWDVVTIDWPFHAYANNELVDLTSSGEDLGRYIVYGLYNQRSNEDATFTYRLPAYDFTGLHVDVRPLGGSASFIANGPDGQTVAMDVDQITIDRFDLQNDTGLWTFEVQFDRFVGQFLVALEGNNVCVVTSPCEDVDVDGDGVYNHRDICDGWSDAIDSDGDGVPDGCDDDPESGIPHSKDAPLPIPVLLAALVMALLARRR